MSPNLLDLVIWPYLSFIRTCKSKLRGPNMAGVKPNQTWKGINRRPNTQVNIPTRLLQHRIQCECWGSPRRETLLDHQRMMSYLIWVDHRAGYDIRGHGQLSVNIIRLREACTWDGQRNRCGATTAASFVERTSLLDSFPHKHKMSESCLPPCVTCHQESDTFSKRLKN